MYTVKTRYLYFLVVLVSLFLVSCVNNKDMWNKVIPKNTFEGPFPKKNKDLSDILGKRIVLTIDKDTVKLNIGMKGGLNLVTMENTGDTLFCGTVSKFRGLYYFSQKLADTAYWIFAVKKEDNKLWGINGMLIEGQKIDREVKSGKYPGLVKYINKDSSIIRLHADKKLIKKLLASYVDSLSPYTILSMDNFADTNFSMKDSDKFVSAIDTDEFELISKVYPNPATDEVNVDLQNKRKVIYKLSDMHGKAIRNGEFTDINNKIDLGDLPSGIYIITASTVDNKTSESVKILKR